MARNEDNSGALKEDSVQGVQEKVQVISTEEFLHYKLNSIIEQNLRIIALLENKQ